MSSADLSQLETTVAEIRGRVDDASLDRSDARADVERSLAELNDEVTYLRVKMRREGSVTREEFTVGARSARDASRPRAAGVRTGRVVERRRQHRHRARRHPARRAPADARSIRERRRSSSGSRPRRSLDYTEGSRVVIPAGSLVRGFVSSVRAAGRIDRRGSLTLSFDELRIGNRTYRLRASVTEALDGKMGDDMKRVGAASVVGAIIGGIIGGTRGALIGVLVGGGGTIAATEGSGRRSAGRHDPQDPDRPAARDRRG